MARSRSIRAKKPPAQPSQPQTTNGDGSGIWQWRQEVMRRNEVRRVTATFAANLGIVMIANVAIAEGMKESCSAMRERLELCLTYATYKERVQSSGLGAWFSYQLTHNSLACGSLVAALAFLWIAVWRARSVELEE